MATLHIVLWYYTAIFDSLFREEIHRVGPLQKVITDALLVLQNLPNRFYLPPILICYRHKPIILYFY